MSNPLLQKPRRCDYPPAMTAVDLVPTPTRQQLAAQGRTEPGKVTGKLKVGIDAMVWQGLDYAQAAIQAGLKAHAIRYALNRQSVKAYYQQQLEVLRASHKARSIHTLADVRDQTDNQMARVQAVKALEQLDDVQHSQGRNAQSSPGFVIVVQGNATVTQQPIIDAKVEPDAAD